MKKSNVLSPISSDILGQIQLNAGYSFKNLELLTMAFVHTSYAAEHDLGNQHNQRLEFLGDAVLQIILSDYLFSKLPDEQEGTLSRVRSLMADEAANQSYACRLGLDKALLLGNGEEHSGGRQRPSILGDLFEAFLGAMYLDGGIRAATRFVLKLVPDVNDCLKQLSGDENPKGTLQQWCQTTYHVNAVYRITGQTGPSHKPVYTAVVSINGEVIGEGSGSSHKLAEKSAAADALSRLRTPQTAEEQPKDAEKETIFALDFDGVICNSATETACAAWKTARKIWPRKFRKVLPPDVYVQSFVQARPYLETGYQSVLMLKLLQEGNPVEIFESGFDELMTRTMVENDLTKEQLIKLFGDTRKDWIATDEAGWLKLHGFYENVIPALAEAMKHHPVMILTTKQETFVKKLLNSQGIDFPEDAIYGLDKGLKKEQILADLRKQHSGAEIRFVEDRIETLERIKADSALKSIRLFYANWGYGKPADAATAQKDRRISLITLPEFCAHLNH